MRLIRFADNPKQSDEALAKVHKLESLYDAANTERKKAEIEWFANCAAAAGSNGEAVVNDALRYRGVIVPYVARKADDRQNLLYALFRQALAAGVDNGAEQIAIPATSDEDDVKAAELGTDFIRYRRDADEESRLHLHEENWRLTCGITYRMTYWDPDKPGYGEDNNGEMILLQGIGDIETRIISPFHMHVCPWNDSSQTREWYILSDVRDTDEIGDMYGKKVEPEEVAESVRASDALLSNVVQGSDTSVGGGSVPRRQHAAILKRLYHIPSKKYPNGRVWTWANDVLLAETDLPEGRMPFTEIIWFPVAGRIYPYPFVTPLRPIQAEIDKTMSQLIELKNRQLRGDMVVRGNAPVEETVNPVTTEWDEETGQKRVWLDPTVLDWKFMEYNLNSAEAERILALKWQYMQVIAGVNSGAMLGQESPGDPTATELAIRKEADTAGLALFRNMRNDAQSKIDGLKLLLAKNHYLLPRMIRVVGEGNKPNVAFFYGAELRNTDDVRARPVPVMSEAQKQVIRQQLAEVRAWDMTGTPQQKANNVQLILASGLPDAREEIEKVAGGVTVEEIFKANGMAIRADLELALKQGEVMNEQADAMLQGGEQEQQPGVFASMAA